MAYRSRDETELDRGREAFRLSSLGCEGYTVGVCAALLCMVCEYTGKAPIEIGGLNGQQLWELAKAGFVATIEIPVLPSLVNDNLCLGEKAAIRVGLWLLKHSIPTGECLGEICEACGFDVEFLKGQIFDAWAVALD